MVEDFYLIINFLNFLIRFKIFLLCNCKCDKYWVYYSKKFNKDFYCLILYNFKGMIIIFFKDKIYVVDLFWNIIWLEN